MSAVFLKLLCLATDLFPLFSEIQLIHIDLFFLQGLTLGGKKNLTWDVLQIMQSTSVCVGKLQGQNS